MDRRSTRADATPIWKRSDVLLWPAVVIGVLSGLVLVIYRNTPSVDRLGPDALKIWRISSGQRPDFRDQSFTPVANVYRFLGLGDAPLAAGLFGFLLAAGVITFVIFRVRPRGVSVALALYIVAAYFVGAFYLGQYSKDVFVLPVTLALLLNRRIWWEIPIVASMLAYTYWFRDYWILITVGYITYRIVTWRQVRIRYLLLIGSVAVLIIGAGNYLVLGNDPNYFRAKVLRILEANTSFATITPFPQPFGGLVDLFVNYWLVILPVLLPLTAGLLYLVVAAGLGFLRLYPLFAARSSRRWPSASTFDGVLVRRSLSLLLAFTAVQAIFEPDYGSVIRHLSPLLPVGLSLLLSMRAGTPRGDRAANSWSWSGEASPRRPQRESAG